jgi:AraC-like DNA-binding protein
MPSTNYAYDDHTSIPFKFVVLQASEKEVGEHPHRHNFFQLFFFTSTGGKHLIDFQERLCEEKSVHVVNPGSIHKLTRTPDTKGFVLLFSRSFLVQNKALNSLFLNRNDFDKFPKLPKKAFEEILNYLDKIQEELSGDQDYQDRTIPFILELILINIQRNISFNVKTNSSQEAQLLAEFKTLINQNFSTQQSLEYYTENLHVSVKKLNAVCKIELNKSAREMVQERILLEASRLLFHSSLSIKEIAFNLGYEDPSYFNRFFKQKTGKTPLLFRTKLKEKYH